MFIFELWIHGVYCCTRISEEINQVFCWAMQDAQKEAGQECRSTRPDAIGNIERNIGQHDLILYIGIIDRNVGRHYLILLVLCIEECIGQYNLLLLVL